MRYSIVEKETGRVVGVLSMMDAERAVPGWELGIEIAPDARRNGFAREALAAVVEAYFAQTETVLFTGGHYAYNTASGELLKKLGFVYEGVEHKAMHTPNAGRPTLCATIWKKNKASFRCPCKRGGGFFRQNACIWPTGAVCLTNRAQAGEGTRNWTWKTSTICWAARSLRGPKIT